MNFIEIDWSNSYNFKNNLTILAHNIFKVKYFYEEDQLPLLSRQVSNPEQLNQIINNYHNIVDEADLCLRALTVLNRASTENFPSNTQIFETLLAFMKKSENDLKGHELSNPARFKEWLGESFLKTA